MTSIRFGILGAAQITWNALLKPVYDCPRARVQAIAARDRDRAAAFARDHGIPTVHRSYADVIDDPEVDAVYIPLPNSYHGAWTLAALAAGKHVLCEKPLTANADEARRIAEAAAASDRVVMEAVHYRYHPLAHRMREVATSGELGSIERVEATFRFPLLDPDDIRYRHDLAGGALMDLGSYGVHVCRMLGAEEPTVAEAVAEPRADDVDGAMRATLAFPSGHTGVIDCALWTEDEAEISCRVIGSAGRMEVLNPLAPQDFPHYLDIHRPSGTDTERFTARPTYSFQLDAFCDAVENGAPVLTPAQDAVATMSVVDDIYRAAGMQPRQPS